MNFPISKRKTFTLILLGLGNLLSGMTYSILAPFYPAEAEKKGASATEYGMVFSIFEFVACISSPILGKYMYKFGPRAFLNLGLLSQAASCIMFGLLDKCDGHTWFISLSLLFRVIEALGSSAYVTASFAVIAIEFPDSMAQTFALLEMAVGAGLIAGPPIGGLLFEVGGYPLPFLGAGGFLLVVAFLSPILAPQISKHSEESQPKLQSGLDSTSSEVRKSGFLDLLKVPGASLAAINVMSAGISNSFMCTILEPHIRQFGLTPVQVTGVFVALLGTYAVSAPAWGWACDRISQTNFVSLAGSVIMVLGTGLIGPAPFLPFKTIIWVTCIGCCLQGLGTGALNVSSFLQLTDWAKKNGYPDDVTTYGLTSGIWFSMLSLGSFIGPLAAGILFDHVGFRMGSLLCIVEHFIMIIIQTSFIIWIWRNPFTRRLSSISASETQPLLNGKDNHLLTTL